jgi:RNA polymerase sigma factor (sigma-70 family)
MMTTATPAAPDGPDSELIARIQGGDRSAFEALYKRYVKKIYGLVFRMVGTAQEAEEVTQEAFFQVYKAIPNFQGKSSFYTWIYRIATNVALQHVKKQVRRRRETSFEEAVETDSVPGFAGSPRRGRSTPRSRRRSTPCLRTSAWR